MADASGNESREPSGTSGQVLRRARINGRTFEFTLDGMITKGPSATIGQYVCSEQLADIITESNCKAHLYLADSLENVRLARDEYRLARLKEAQMSHSFSFGINKTVHYHGDYWTITATPSSHGNDCYMLLNKDGKSISVVPSRFLNEAKPADQSVEHTPANPYLEPAQTTEAQQTYEGSIVLDDEQLFDVVKKRVDDLFESRMEEFLDKCAERLGRTIESSGNDSPGDMATEAEHKE